MSTLSWDEVQVTVIATGFDSVEDSQQNQQTSKISSSKTSNLQSLFQDDDIFEIPIFLKNKK